MEPLFDMKLDIPLFVLWCYTVREQNNIIHNTKTKFVIGTSMAIKGS